MNYIAVCPKCERIYHISENIKEAWCQHYISNEDGSPDKRFPKEKVTCKIVKQNDKTNSDMS